MNWRLRLLLSCLVLASISATAVFAQSKRVTGRVVDESGGLMVGLAVIEKDSKPINGVTTDANGNYVITVASSNSVLQFSSIGYEDYAVKVGGTNVIDVVMREATSELDQVVVVGFGEQRKKDVIGSVSTIKVSNLRVPTSNLTTVLAGQAAGVISYQRTGEPGQDNADFFIRGVTSFGTGKRNPLILIDGMEVGTTELARLRPDDIESFSIFKDATSTAVYGARGANGVIYVTTKRGSEGKLNVNFRAEGSMSAPTKDVEFADPITYMNLYNDAILSRNPFADPEYSQEEIYLRVHDINPVAYPKVDWKNQLFKRYTFNHRYHMSVNGGGKVATYFVSGSFSQDNGVLNVDRLNNFNNNINLKSYTLRSNVELRLTPTTEIMVRLNGNFDDYVGPVQGGNTIYAMVVRANPVDFVPVYPINEDNRYVTHPMFGAVRDKAYINPYAEMVSGYKNYNRSMMMAQMELKQNLKFITEGLSFRAMFNTNRVSRFDIERSYNPFYYAVDSYSKLTGKYTLGAINADTGTEYLSFRENEKARKQVSEFYFETTMNYKRTFRQKHSLSGMLVYLMRSSSEAQPASLQLSLPHRNMGVSGRFTYGCDDRYIAEVNFGYNGSERFSKEHRYGFFPSFGLAWNVSNEAFWKPWKESVSLLKVRVTYGLVGNDQIGSASDRFFYLSNLKMSDGAKSWGFGSELNNRKNGITVTNYANPNVTWEISKKANLAFEVQLFNKLNINADFYQERRSNILMNRADIPSTMGLTAPVRANVGEASGRGMDISMDYSESFKNGFWLTLRGNFTYATSRYEVYEEPVYKEYWKSHVGRPLNQPYGYIAERLFADDSEVANSPTQSFGGPAVIAGDIKYLDVNGDGEITSLDQVPIGFPTVPEIIYGGGFSFGYKHFDLSAFFQGSARSSFWTGSNGGPATIEPFVGGRQILKVYAEDHFSVSNPNLYALWPRLSDTYSVNNMQFSTWWLNNGSFLRLKQLEMGYTLPEKLTNRFGMSTLRFYVSGTNLLLFSRFKLWDVEMGGNGLGYPIQRVVNFGVNLTF